MPERLVASLRLLHGCKAEADARCVLVSASRHSDGECLPPRPRTCTDCGLQRSRHEAPTDGTSLRLLCTDCGLQRSRYEAPTDGASLAARCEAEADARCVLVSASGTRMESAWHGDHAPALIAVCNGAAMKPRPIDWFKFVFILKTRRAEKMWAIRRVISLINSPIPYLKYIY